jgi:hypothetical protein
MDYSPNIIDALAINSDDHVFGLGTVFSNQPTMATTGLKLTTDLQVCTRFHWLSIRLIISSQEHFLVMVFSDPPTTVTTGLRLIMV